MVFGCNTTVNKSRSVFGFEKRLTGYPGRDIEFVKRRLPHRGVFPRIVVPALDEARELQRYIRNWRTDT